MLRSLFSGISGLRAHQTMLDVTGNNIANVNTTGFKASQTQFQDTLSQMIQGAGAPQAGQGGTNPAQIGLGVRVAGVTTNFTQGAAQLTGRSTDMMIDGDGFFVVSRGTDQFYTRAGAFDFDASGQLVGPGGTRVQGWSAAVGGAINTNSPLVDLRLPVGTLIGAQASTGATFEGNLPGDAATGTVLTREIEVYDAVGAARALVLTFTKTVGGWSMDATDGTASVLGTAVTFDASGAITAPAATVAVGGVAVDLLSLTGFAGLTTIEASNQNGRQAGQLQSFELTADGTIIGSFSNGLKEAVGRIAMTSFANPAGLAKAGGSLYAVTVNSGEPQIGTAGTGGRGSLSGGALEMSNVDLSQEFTNLIVAQRGFQANSRVITTSDELLQELVNLKR